MTIKLYKHQEDAVTRMVNGGVHRHGWFMEPGLGKTLTMLTAVSCLPRVRWLVLCPLSVIDTAWCKDAAHFPDLKVKGLWAPTAAKRRKLIDSQWDVGVINFDSFKLHRKEFDAAGIGGLIVDESTKVSNPDSKVTKSVMEFQHGKDYCYALSGMPTPNDESQLFSQLRIVSDGQAWKAWSYYGFLSRFFWQRAIVGPRGNKIKVGRPKLLANMAESLWEEAAKWSTSIRKRDVLDLPEKIKIVVPVTPSKEEGSAYEDMHDICMAELSDGTVIQTEGVGQIGKLAQITGGGLYSHDDAGQRHYTVIGKSKLLALDGLLNDQLEGNKVLIWAIYQAEVERIAEHLGVPFIHGGINPSRRGGRLAEFIEGDAKYLVAHPATLGHGTDGIQRVCSNQVNYSWDYSWDVHNQAMDRTNRIGAIGDRSAYYYLCVPGSIDEIKLASLEGKWDRSKYLMEVLRAGSQR